MKKAEIAASVTVPSMFIAQASLNLSMMQTGGSILDFLRPVMPFISQFLGFFGNLLIPLGKFFGDLLQGPLTALNEAIPNRDWTGYAPYLAIFAAIFIAALYLNVIWRPLGYATAESRAKRDQKLIREVEKEEAKEAAKKEAKARRKGSKTTPVESGKDVPPDKANSGQPSTENPKGTDQLKAVPSPPPAVAEKFVDKGGQIDDEKDDGTAADEEAEKKGD
jgi:hypothetical protein